MTNLILRIFVRDHDNIKDLKVRSNYGKVAGVVGICTNVLLAAFKLLVGFLSGSVAITADGFNNLSDAFSAIITVVGFKMAAKPADKEHPYGHARIEYLAALCVGIIIFMLGFELVQDSFFKILNPTDVTLSPIMVAVILLSVFVKLWLMFFYKKVGAKISSVTIEATATDCRNDIISTVAVLLAVVVSNYTPLNIDGFMGLVVALFIMYSGCVVLKNIVDTLLGMAPSKELVAHIQNKILTYEEVVGTHDLMVHDYGPGRRFGSAHVEIDAAVDAMKSHNIIDKIERDLAEEDNIHFVIHYDPVLVGDETVTALKDFVEKRIKNVMGRLSIHDFRVVAGPKHTNLIFDIVVPYDYTATDEQIKKQVQSLVEEEETKFYTVVTVDRAFVE